MFPCPSKPGNKTPKHKRRGHKTPPQKKNTKGNKKKKKTGRGLAAAWPRPIGRGSRALGPPLAAPAAAAAAAASAPPAPPAPRALCRRARGGFGLSGAPSTGPCTDGGTCLKVRNPSPKYIIIYIYYIILYYIIYIYYIMCIVFPP